MTASDRDRDEEAYDKPVVTDKRRIDPETGKARQTPAEQTATEAPSSTDGGATGAAADAAPATAEAPATGEGAPADGALAAAQAEALDLADQLARRNADIYNVQQEYSAYVRRSKTDAAGHRQAGQFEVIEALLGVLDDLEMARQHGDLVGPAASIAEKLEGTLAQRFDVVRYGTVGDEFDPVIHEALMHATDPSATTTAITQVLQPGYRAGEKVLRPARVAVTSPE
ncbi:nucleotide exchange factor GrpE [Georgenia sp. SYP-B2076]|uniref:nucleotide exchange factor GrpE n=1 Tax=Georgenia sp. SYP-B2076 TaxID=2495881 RepID=UPI000F8E8195|nr:nucleotide exchange factor GrpE [Georgenia sp. SYP-B2076]